MLFWPKTDVPENNSGRECLKKNQSTSRPSEYPPLIGGKMSKRLGGIRECCWPYRIGQSPLSPVFGQKRPSTPSNSYFAQLPPVFGHFMFLSGGLLECSNRSTWATRNVLVCLSFCWCPCMAINGSVQYDGEFLPDIILLTQCYYHRGTRLNAMKRFCIFSY